MNTEFPCERCGMCCTFCDLHADLMQFDSGEGICIHLKNTPDLLAECAIYENRPDICNVEKTFKNKNETDWEKYLQLNKGACAYTRNFKKEEK